MVIDAHAQIVINQVMYDSPFNEVITQPPYSNGEFVELYNVGDTALCLKGWHLNGSGVTEHYTFPDTIVLQAHSYLSVAYRHYETTSFLLDSLIHLPHGYLVLYQRKFILSNAGEGLSIYNADGERVDTMLYMAKSAQNADSIPLAQCVGLQRIGITYDENRTILYRSEDWTTGLINFALSYPERLVWLPSADYYNHTDTLPADNAYIVRVDARSSMDSVVSVKGHVHVKGGGIANVAVEWLDPLSRSLQNTQRRATQQGEALSTFTEHLSLAATRQWLPRPSATGLYVQPAIAEEQTMAYYDNEAPYVGTTIEHTYQGRVLTRTQAGDAFQNHPATDSYDVNSSNEIRHWIVTATGATRDGYYPAGTLRKTTHTDEDGKITTRYTDSEGRTIALLLGGADYTYYLYNDMGQLRYVLPPNVYSALLPYSSFTDDNFNISHFCYTYYYDDHGLCIYKRLPSCAPQYFVYDCLGRLVMSQDGNQRQRGNYWTTQRYDKYNQVAYICEVETSGETQSELATMWRNQSATVTFSVEGDSYAVADIGYQDSLLSGRIHQMLIVNYYDNYNYLQTLPSATRDSLLFNDKGYGSLYSNSTGLLTGQRVYTLGDTVYQTISYYYDQKSHVIQQRCVRPDSTTLNKYISYYFDGRVMRTMEEQPNITEKYLYEYDLQGRLARTLYKLNNEPFVTLVGNVYNDLGQMVARYRHNHHDDCAQTYDIRGRVTHRGNGDVDEYLIYVKDGKGYNGTISSITLTQADTTLMWNFAYDARNRLTDARLVSGDTSFVAEHISYGVGGKIDRLVRRSSINAVPQDSISYSYSGVQITWINDWQTRVYYDLNGNMKADSTRHISSITYNLLNLPERIVFTNGNSIVNSYDATGSKLSTTTYTVYIPDSGPVDTIKMTKHYLGHAEYVTSGTSVTREYMVQNAEGYVSFSTAEDTIQYLYYYYRLDHLGNVLAVWDATNDTTAQRMYYYPTGVPMPLSTGQDKQPYTYNGKEYVNSYGYDIYDYGFRGYNARIGYFTTMDPMCEQTPWQSPYTYASNNFIAEIDWMGLYSSFGNSNVGGLNYIVIDSDGYVKGVVENDDWSIYLDEEGNWKPEKGLNGLEKVGVMLLPYSLYRAMMDARRFGLRIPAYGLYDFSALCYVSYGAQIKLSQFGVLQNLALNLCSIDFLSISIELDAEQVFNLNIIGRDDDTHIRMDVSFENLSIRRSFLIESLTGRYIADSGENNVALTIPGNHRFSMGHDGKISFSGELAFLMGISGSVSFYLVYPAKQKHHEE